MRCLSILAGVLAAAGVAKAEISILDSKTAADFEAKLTAWAGKTGSEPDLDGWKAAMLKWKEGALARNASAHAALVGQMWDVVSTKKEATAAELAAFWEAWRQAKECPTKDTLIFGIDVNTIYEVNVSQRSARAVLDVAAYLGDGADKTFNSYAYDQANSIFYFMNSNSAIVAWNRNSGAVGIVAPSQTVGSNPANAAFYDGALWFVEKTNNLVSTVTLVRVGFTPAAGPNGLPTLGGKSTYTVNLKKADGSPFVIRNGYGDIAVSAAGDLYITPVVLVPGKVNNGPLLVVKDLVGSATGGGGTMTATTIAQDGVNGPQTSFGCDGTTLWAQDYEGSAWGILDTTTGVTTPQFNITLPGAADPTKGLRDLGGPACDCVPAKT